MLVEIFRSTYIENSQGTFWSPIRGRRVGQHHGSVGYSGRMYSKNHYYVDSIRPEQLMLNIASGSLS
jgi:hypothetical protein